MLPPILPSVPHCEHFVPAPDRKQRRASLVTLSVAAALPQTLACSMFVPPLVDGCRRPAAVQGASRSQPSSPSPRARPGPRPGSCHPAAAAVGAGSWAWRRAWTPPPPGQYKPPCKVRCRPCRLIAFVSIVLVATRGCLLTAALTRQLLSPVLTWLVLPALIRPRCKVRCGLQLNEALLGRLVEL